MLLTVLGLTVSAIASDDLPVRVKNTIAKHGSVTQVDEAYSEIDEDNKLIIYFITLKKGNQFIYLEIDQNGKLLDKNITSSEEEEEEIEEF